MCMCVYVYQIKFTTTKLNEEHKIRFKEDIHKQYDIDVIYWFNKHLQKNFDLSLDVLADRAELAKLKENKNKLYRQNTCVMSLKFRYVIFSIM